MPMRCSWHFEKHMSMRQRILVAILLHAISSCECWPGEAELENDPFCEGRAVMVMTQSETLILFPNDVGPEGLLENFKTCLDDARNCTCRSMCAWSCPSNKLRPKAYGSTARPYFSHILREYHFAHYYPSNMALCFRQCGVRPLFHSMPS